MFYIVNSMPQPLLDEVEFTNSENNYNVGLEDNRWVVGESSASAHVLNLHRDDLLYVGGGAIPDQLKSTKLLSSGTFSGVLFHLEVDGRIVGLWNLVTSAGCRETHSGVLQGNKSR